jgi:putative endonuclease
MFFRPCVANSGLFSFMYYCYIIYSPSKDRYYIGSYENIPERLRRHNTNHKEFTGGQDDWTLRWSQSFNSKQEELNRKRQIKGWKSRKMIERVISAT